MAEKIIIHGSYNAGNFGDMVLLDMLARHIDRRWGVRAVCPWVHSDDRDKIDANAGRGWRSCVNVDAAIFGGGGYFNCIDEKQSQRRLLRYSAPAKWWRMRGMPYCIVGVGAGPELSGAGIERVKSICNGALAVCARDDATQELLVRAGVAPDKIEVTADLALSLNRGDISSKARNEAAEALQMREGGNKPRRVGLHFMPGKLPAERLEAIAASIGALVAKRDDVQLYWLLDHATKQSEKIERLRDAHTPNATIVSGMSHWGLAALLGELDAVFTTKLHVGIIAWTLGVPCCGYSSHGKTQRFYEQVGREQFQASANEDPAVVTSWMQMFLNDPAGFKQEKADARSVLRDRAKRNYEVVDTMLKSIIVRK